MLDLEQFAEGLIAIGLRLQKPVDAATIRVYYADLASETTLPEWRAFVPVAVKRYRWEFFPSVPKLLEALEEFRASLESQREDSSLLVAGRRDPEAARENHIRGFASFRAELVRRGLLQPDAPEPVESMPGGSR
jgi:hypothetical protein